MARTVDATVTGQLLKHLVKAGDTIAAGTDVAMIECMKMHIPVAAELSGKVAAWLIGEGSAVKEGQDLLVLDA